MILLAQNGAAPVSSQIWWRAMTLKMPQRWWGCSGTGGEDFHWRGLYKCDILPPGFAIPR
jgi:hypothetical protein